MSSRKRFDSPTITHWLKCSKGRGISMEEGIKTIIRETANATKKAMNKKYRPLKAALVGSTLVNVYLLLKDRFWKDESSE